MKGEMISVEGFLEMFLRGIFKGERERNGFLRKMNYGNKGKYIK